MHVVEMFAAAMHVAGVSIIVGWQCLFSVSEKYVTTYYYIQPDVFGEHRMMLRPRDDEGQKVIETELEITLRPRTTRLDLG